MVVKAYSFLSDFDERLTFDKVQLPDNKKDPLSSSSLIFEDNIKIKSCI